MVRAAVSREESFESALREVFPECYRRARYLTGDEVEAQDVLQEAVLLALKGYDTFQPGTNFRAWFRRVLANAFYMRWRKERRRARVIRFCAFSDCRPPAACLDGGSAGPAEAYLNAVTRQRIVEAIHALPARYRTVARLYFLQDKPYEEIAASLACPVGTVRSRLHRGRKLLRAALRPVAEEHGILPV